ncbi:Protein translocase subunit SecA [Porphyridium purpureum]|uniref:Protein translocase subunit SecA n=1 Tax=Porphyridium purpureum TaxID=35688 RepID=A0A5J4Z3L2_PORPP|nr:Protein translocase subunit SecA [Porphyridium purpureum]|eukprot:POR5225..scf295_1
MSLAYVVAPVRARATDGQWLGARQRQLNGRPFSARVRRGVALRMGLLDSIKGAITGGGADASAEKSRRKNPFRSVVGTLTADDNERWLASAQLKVDAINAREDEIEALSDEELAAKTQQFRAALKDGSKNEDDLLVEAFAVVREAAFRVLGLRHFDVQLLGGIALHEGKIAEMATGEGKTLVSTLPVYLNALRGDKNVLVVTVNDYLAKRDAKTMGKVHAFLGLSVGLIQAFSTSEQRKHAYSCALTYVTNSELGFDYLRDHLALTKDEVVLTTRPLGYCIVDEADSILIDEARTPLIISGKLETASAKYSVAAQLAAQLQPKKHYNVNEKEQSVILSEAGTDICERALKVSSLFDPANPWAPFISNALKAKEILKADINYVVKNSQVLIVDDFTGRVMEGRRWGNGLHQAVEAKEQVPISDETQTIASVSFQSFFGGFAKLSGMTGTASSDAGELLDVYGLTVVQIPTALPLARKDYPDVVFKTSEGKWRAVMREIAIEHPKGRPILIGTTSVENSETLSALLTEVEVPHQVLNARPELAEKESEIIAQAGRKYAITIATNMAGRGTDILLGGNTSFFARSVLRDEMITALRGCKAAAKAVKALALTEASLPVDLSGEQHKELLAAVQRAVAEDEKLIQSCDTPAKFDRLIDDLFSGSSSNADELEGGDSSEACTVADATLSAVEDAYRSIYEELAEATGAEKEEVMSLGGLYVIGTEKHDAKRIDNQLRGRAGRQGDPGGSRFILGLDDKLFRVFGGERMQKVLNAFRVEEDTPIENSMVTGAIDQAQDTVESYYAELRASLAEYDKVQSLQRNDMYARRSTTLFADDESLHDECAKMCMETAQEIFKGYVGRGREPDDFAGLSNKLKQFFDGIESVDAAELEACASSDRLAYVEKQVGASLERKEAEVDASANTTAEVERFILISQYDMLWKQHLQNMGLLQEVVGYEAMGEGNPVDLYRQRAKGLYEDVWKTIRRNTVFSLFQYKPKSSGKGNGTNANSSNNNKKSKKR